MAHLELMPASDLLRWAIDTYGSSFAIGTSFQQEGMALIDMAARLSSSVRVFTIDTGRLPEETYQMIETVRERYGLAVEVVSPDHDEVESMVASHGPNLFYQSPERRLLCCQVRKVRPLERKLATLQAWAVGLRRSQSAHREVVTKVDNKAKTLKLSPLADWTVTQVRDYVLRHDVPQHRLYARGYTSIGCAPCTRAPWPGENERAGRWWWERDIAKECGIHFSADGKLQRSLDILVDEITAGTHA